MEKKLKKRYFYRFLAELAKLKSNFEIISSQYVYLFPSCIFNKCPTIVKCVSRLACHDGMGMCKCVDSIQKFNIMQIALKSKFKTQTKSTQRKLKNKIFKR